MQEVQLLSFSSSLVSFCTIFPIWLQVQSHLKLDLLQLSFADDATSLFVCGTFNLPSGGGGGGVTNTEIVGMKYSKGNTIFSKTD